MGRSPAPVARGPGRLLSLPATRRPGANKAAESNLPPSPRRPLPPRAHVTRGPRPRRRVRTPTGRGAAKAPPGPRIPQVSVMGRGRGGRVQARLPSRLAEGGGGSGDQTWAGGNHLLQPPLSPPHHHHHHHSRPGKEKSPERSPRTWGIPPPILIPPPTLGWAWGAGGGDSLCKALVYALFVYISFQRYRVPFLDSAGCFRLSQEYTGLEGSCLEPD